LWLRPFVCWIGEDDRDEEVEGKLRVGEQTLVNCEISGAWRGWSSEVSVPFSNPHTSVLFECPIAECLRMVEIALEECRLSSGMSTGASGMTDNEAAALCGAE
jgi:hypothetical protein